MNANFDSEAHGSYGRLYNTLVSTKTALLFLAVFGILFFLGAIFPQNSDPNRLEQYRAAGGKLILLVDALDLLNIFGSRYFGIITILFVLHVLLCAIHRFGLLRRRSPIRLFSREDLLRRDQSFAIICSRQAAEPDIEKVLKRIGFRRRKYYSEDPRAVRIVCEKGLPYRWLSWLYHLCFVIAIIGLATSYLFALAGSLVIEVGETAIVTFDTDDTRWRKIVGGAVPKDSLHCRKIELTLGGFISEYAQKPELVYPEKPIQRSLAVWGLGGESVRYEMPADSLYPRDWFADLTVSESGRLAKRQKINVNNPLRYAGVSFYQVGHDYAFDLHIGNEIIENIKARVPFTIPQMEGEFQIKDPYLGMLFAYDGAVGKLAPRAKLQHRPPSGRHNAEWTTAGELPIGHPIEVMHALMMLDNLRESSVLRYRRDPGAPLLWIAGIGLVILMTARIYLPWYQLRCHVAGSGEHAQVTVSIRMMGLLARPARLQHKLCTILEGRVEHTRIVSS